MVLISKTRCKQSLFYVVGLSCFSAIIFFSLIEPNLPLPVGTSEKRADFAFEGVRLSQLELGQVVWTMVAQKATVEKKANRAILKDVTGVFYKKEVIVLSVVSPLCHLDMDASDLSLENSKAVFHVNDRQVLLEASQLDWHAGSQQFEGRGLVKIQSDGLVMKGDMFKVDLPSQTLMVSEHSQAEIMPERFH
ncbi:MAG: hypothetical protein EXS67_00660 [Candidatus Margulisbacteria bacterium]|nr:hypothetical protein [Candidatus Margulisiibacteriota bacterium]